MESNSTSTPTSTLPQDCSNNHNDNSYEEITGYPEVDDFINDYFKSNSELFKINSKTDIQPPSYEDLSPLDSLGRPIETGLPPIPPIEHTQTMPEHKPQRTSSLHNKINKNSVFAGKVSQKKLNVLSDSEQSLKDIFLKIKHTLTDEEYRKYNEIISYHMKKSVKLTTIYEEIEEIRSSKPII